ncbi:MAG: polysaccharide deacetylase family protein [Coxiellaceae bacterium]|nr:polysaccharide deacetylase family protein [Coxiellaceae bacterium]
MNALRWKRKIGKLYAHLYAQSNNRCIILIYHAVGYGPWAISPDSFQAQISWLQKHCDIVSLSELLKPSDYSPRIRVAITFDDGYACLYQHVLPFLKKATVYLNTNWIGDEPLYRINSNSELGHYPSEQFLTWDEVKILEQSGWEIGSHGADHLDLTQQAAEKIASELRHSKEHIENKLQKPCHHFAYTWGRHNKNLRNTVATVGYHTAVAAHHQMLSHTDDVFSLPRLNVDRNYSLDDFKRVVLGEWDFIRFVHRVRNIAL